MIGSERECEKCGHPCHCYSPSCPKCVNDVCTQCKCKDVENFPYKTIQNYNVILSLKISLMVVIGSGAYEKRNYYDTTQNTSSITSHQSNRRDKMNICNHNYTRILGGVCKRTQATIAQLRENNALQIRTKQPSRRWM